MNSNEWNPYILASYLNIFKPRKKKTWWHPQQLGFRCQVDLFRSFEAATDGLGSWDLGSARTQGTEMVMRWDKNVGNIGEQIGNIWEKMEKNMFDIILTYIIIGNARNL